jgi:hypothetical protein
VFLCRGDCATCEISLAGRMTKPCVAKVPAEPRLKSLQEKGLEIRVWIPCRLFGSSLCAYGPTELEGTGRNSIKQMHAWEPPLSPMMPLGKQSQKWIMKSNLPTNNNHPILSNEVATETNCRKYSKISRLL